MEWATVRDPARLRCHSQGGAGRIKVLPSCSPFSPTSCWDPPLAKSNQKVRGPRVLWTRSMLVSLPGPSARERWVVGTAGGQRTRWVQG